DLAPELRLDEDGPAAGVLALELRAFVQEASESSALSLAALPHGWPFLGERRLARRAHRVPSLRLREPGEGLKEEHREEDGDRDDARHDARRVDHEARGALGVGRRLRPGRAARRRSSLASG